MIQRTEQEHVFAFPVDEDHVFSGEAPVIELTQAEEESWFVPQRVELWLTFDHGKSLKATVWIPQMGAINSGISGIMIAPKTELQMQWVKN